MFTIFTQPDTYSAAYSAMPLNVFNPDSLTNDNYSYLVNILYSTVTITGHTATQLNGQIFTSCATAVAHDYTIGDTIYLNDTSNNIYSGMYNVMSVPNNNSFVINLTMGTPITANTNASITFRYIQSPLENFDGRFDISKTIKNFVTQDLQDVSITYDASNTVWDYNILLADEKKYVFEFYDNGYFFGFGYGDAGKISFWQSGATSLDGIPFQIGDQIIIQQYQQEWNYNTTFGNGVGSVIGNLVLSSTTTNHNFSVGQQINITGQITNPQWNGPATVLSVPADPKYWMTTSIPLQPTGTTVDEAGVVFGTPVPSYNTIATIVDINVHPTYGVVISTNITNAGSTKAIGGQIRYANGRVTEYADVQIITGLTAYNARFENLQYEVDEFDPYVIQSRSASLNNLSTILSRGAYRIEQSTKSFLLSHGYLSGYSDSAMFKFYNTSNTLISQVRLNNSGDNTKDFYIPVGIDQLIASTGTTLVSGSSLSSIADNVDYYTVEGCKTTTIRTNPIRFQLNDDCSRYEIFHLMWKDALGSWLSYPFIMVHRDFTEVDRKSYYKKEGKWSNGTFGYDTFGRGEQQYFTRSRDKMILNSGWVNEDENFLFKDLMKSNSVYVQLPTGELLGCMIDNREIELRTEDVDNIWNYEFTIRLSNNDIRY